MADAEATHVCAPKYKYDVVISSGPRQRIASRLFRGLRDKGFVVYRSGARFEGECLHSPTIEAIEESRITIVILCKKYASCWWCLDELKKILECRKTKNQLVFPIFVKINPSDVRQQRGSYGEAMAEHELRFGSDSKKVQNWRSALTQVANLRGWELPTGYTKYKEILEWVSKSLRSSPSLPGWPLCPRPDVYVSFTGEDTPPTFENDLYDALCSNGFRAFISDGSLESQIDFGCKSDMIGYSRIAIVVLSQNFASSECCLYELVKILECKKMNNQLVCPIFYNLDLSDVRHHSGSYGVAVDHHQLEFSSDSSLEAPIPGSRMILEESYNEAMANHKRWFGSDSNEVQKWSSALTEVASLSGWHFKPGYKCTDQCIKDIVQWVTKSYEFTQDILQLVTNSLPRYDVYLRFTGQDIPLTLRGDLYDAMLRNSFRAYINDGSLKQGNEIELRFIKAIEDSMIAIVVLSENFASSACCLHELMMIIECKKKRNHLVYPIFYNVDPSHVKHQTGSYAEAMDHHECWFGSDFQELPKWRSALTEVADLSGWHVESMDQYSSELIERIVERVSESLRNLPRYDVFLSVVDTRCSFTSHLYDALCQAGFKTFMNDEVLEGEDQISSSLTNAIEQSMLSIIVFSEYYGFSSSCLDQLVKILECRKIEKQLVWPIFYKVQALDIRLQRNSYGIAMAAHENRFGKDSEKVLKWRSALYEVSYLREWHFKSGDESELIRRIVEDALDI